MDLTSRFSALGSLVCVWSRPLSSNDFCYKMTKDMPGHYGLYRCIECHVLVMLQKDVHYVYGRMMMNSLLPPAYGLIKCRKEAACDPSMNSGTACWNVSETCQSIVLAPLASTWFNDVWNKRIILCPLTLQLLLVRNETCFLWKLLHWMLRGAGYSWQLH